MVSFVQLQDRQMSGICHWLLLSYLHHVIYTTVFREAKDCCPVQGIGALEGDINVCFFFPFSPVYLCAESSHLSLATYVHHPVCLITANGVLPRQPAASESLFPSDCSRPVCFCYLSPTMVRRRGVGGGFTAWTLSWQKFVNCRDVLNMLTPFLQTLNFYPVNQNVYGERSYDSARFLRLLLRSNS